MGICHAPASLSFAPRLNRFPTSSSCRTPIRSEKKDPSMEGYSQEHGRHKLHIIDPIMRKLIPILILLLPLLTSSCGSTNPALAPDSPSPASIRRPQTGASPTTIFKPNPSYSQNIRFEQFSLEEGLSQSVANVILQDHMGFLWIGTEDGLNRFDGYKFKIYKPDQNDPSSLSDRWITALEEDEQGNLWVGTRFGGLNRYDPKTGTFSRFLYNSKDPNSISDNHITALSADGDGIWIGSESGLDFLDTQSLKVEHLRADQDNPHGLGSNKINSLLEHPSGKLWIGTWDAGLYLYDQAGKSFEPFRHSEDTFTSIGSNRILSIFMDRQGTLWVGTPAGLNRSETDGRYFTHYTSNPDDPDSLGGDVIYSIHQDSSDSIWIGTNNGLDRYDARRDNFTHHYHQPSVPNSLAANEVLSIHEDNSGVLWIGTFGGGLNKYNRQQDYFPYYRNNPDDPNSLIGNLVMPIVVGGNGTAWIGSYGSGLNRFNFNANHFKRYEHDPENPNSISNNEIISLALDRQGLLWIGTNRGLDLLDPNSGKFTHFVPEANDQNSLAGAPVYTIYEDHLGVIWIGTNRGLDQFEPQSQSFIHYESEMDDPNSLDNNQITAILEDEDLNFWIGTFDDGLKYFNPNNGRIITYKNDSDDSASLGNNSILSLHLDRTNTLWIGTGGGGLNRFEEESGTFTRFTEMDGLPNNVIYGILEDGQANLWLSTNFGLSRFDPINRTFRNFTASDGLQSNEFSQNAFAKDNRGNLYFGGVNGFNVFSPEKIEDNPIPPAIVLTSISQDGAALNRDVTAESLEQITLAWPQNSFEFEFAALAYGQPSKNQYSYILENFDSNWITIGNQRNGRYTNLPGGSYTLRLRGSNSDGTWNDEEKSIKLTVVPPFWETWWFQSLMLLALATSIAGGLRWRVKSIEGRNRELERLVQKRTADLEKRTGEIDALYQADEKILRNVTLNQVFQTLVDVSVSMLKADRSMVFAWDEEQRKILPRVSRGFRPETLYALKFDENEGFVGRAMKTGEPIIVEDLKSKDLRGDVQTVIRSEGIQSFAHFPIVVDGVVVAIFNVGFTRPNALNDDNIRLFTALVNRAVLSIANMQLFEQTKDLAVMEERNRLARDLHDSAKQKAFAALAQLGTANGMWKTKSDDIQPHLSEAETLVSEVIQELTFLIQEIYPIALQDKGLPTTLREYIFEWENRNDALVNLTVQNERPLPLETEQAIYRVIQEALANISRHSRAAHVNVSLVYNQDSLQAMISDDGCGFDMDQKIKGVGFRSMRDRIGSIRGTIQIQSAPGQGTRVIVQLPLKALAGVERV